MATLLKDKIKVETHHGTCDIELMFGSVTKLSKEDEVDVLVVSAYPGDYEKTPTSVIGALWRDLGIDVEKLSMNKEEDLRKLFSCWWSKPIPSNCGFKKLLCFEGGYKHGARPPTVVSEVFKSLVSMSNNEDIKAMMPLLAAGDQGYDEKLMLRSIVDAAIHWMQIGLPLKVLKIVIYSKDPERDIATPHLLIGCFQRLKTRWEKYTEDEKRKAKAKPIKYDIYLSYSAADETLARKVQDIFQEQNGNIRIYSQRQAMNKDRSWQDEIYEVMSSSARVVTLLSPNFLLDDSCMEQYNIALCCTRDMHRDYLVPLYVQDVDEMPTYMSLIQYQDCRPLDYQKISHACRQMLEWLDENVPLLENEAIKVKTILETKASPKPIETKYDIFISYSHRNKVNADKIHKYVSALHPDWKIFIDTEGLRTGDSWQPKLYSCIESSRIVMALLSKAYINSKVCQEEHNLALAMHHDDAYDTSLMLVLLEDIPSLPVWCRGRKSLECQTLSEKELRSVYRTAKAILGNEKSDDLKILTVSRITALWRQEHFKAGLPYFLNIPFRELTNRISPRGSPTPSSYQYDILLSNHQEEKKYADFLIERVKHFLPDVRVSYSRSDEVRCGIMDKAALIIPLLSPKFSSSAGLKEELNTALCRHRSSDRVVLFPVLLEELPSFPAYFRLLCCLFGCSDDHWLKESLTEGSASDTSNPIADSSAVCLNNVAKVVAFMVSNPDSVKGSFKTILNTEELVQSVSSLENRRTLKGGFNPLIFKSSHAGHTVPQRVHNNPSGAESRCRQETCQEKCNEEKDKQVMRPALNNIQETSFKEQSENQTGDNKNIAQDSQIAVNRPMDEMTPEVRQGRVPLEVEDQTTEQESQAPKTFEE